MIASAESGDGPIVLVLAPTRELAVQIQQECIKFGSSSRIKNTCVSLLGRRTRVASDLSALFGCRINPNFSLLGLSSCLIPQPCIVVLRLVDVILEYMCCPGSHSKGTSLWTCRTQ